MQISPAYLTEEGFKRLQEQLIRLKRALPNLIAEAARTAAYGDRSENEEYKEAKSTLRRTNRQILSIQDQIKRAVIIKPGPNASGTVQLGSIVILETGSAGASSEPQPNSSLQVGGTQKTFQIVGSHETDPEKGRISHQSPLGAALMNHAKGDTVTIQTRIGAKKYLILEIQ